MNNFLIVLVLLGLCIGLGESTVTISNQLKHNKLLGILCDNYKGYQMLKIGEDYNFNVSLDSSDPVYEEQYSCTLYQGPNFKYRQEFIVLDDAWSEGGLEVTSKWIAREDGIYSSRLLNNPLKWDGSHLLKN
ncbi:hypothetical protein BRARA_J02748 [Brassica rapa]|uniref:Uncharacterized protein n=2 Tax=Brassica TaxID=3705 RepID=A0A397XP08_BRACM|nr:hypothetical protein BRARA_J02748 [Brassica rapa]CAF2361048.1 unnamed protein product [Brassica napus]CAG7912037.1 unnamed protein product [Brassica rapa]VDD21109.1 unnamed protein product [Brassica rapa]